MKHTHTINAATVTDYNLVFSNLHAKNISRCQQLLLVGFIAGFALY